MISSETVLVNGTPRHVIDLCRRVESAVTEEDESDTYHDSHLATGVTCESEGQHSSAQLTSEEDTKDENDQTSGNRGNVGNLTEKHPTLSRRSTRQKQAPPPCHICDQSVVYVVQIGMNRVQFFF